MAVFNSTLEEVMSLQDESAGDVPVILTTLTDAIFSLNGTAASNTPPTLAVPALPTAAASVFVR